MKGLSLHQLVLDQAGGLAMSLDFGALPSGSPAEWAQRGHDSFELRMRFSDVSDLSVRGTPNLMGRTLSLVLGPGEARLTSSSADFSVSFKFDRATADLHPYNARNALDSQERWYR
jgi:hypothetical protein